MKHKKSVKNQNYEDYWQLTLGNTDFYGTQFVRILKLMGDHIDKYGLVDKSEDELVKGNGQHKKFNQEVTYTKELEDKVYNLYPKVDRLSRTIMAMLLQLKSILNQHKLQKIVSAYFLILCISMLLLIQAVLNQALIIK